MGREEERKGGWERVKVGGTGERGFSRNKTNNYTPSVILSFEH